MTASVPAWEFVELCSSFVDMMEPSAHTPPVFEVVAPLSVPMNTPGVRFMMQVTDLRGFRGWT
jgi:hypothetical protein